MRQLRRLSCLSAVWRRQPVFYGPKMRSNLTLFILRGIFLSQRWPARGKSNSAAEAHFSVCVEHGIAVIVNSSPSQLMFVQTWRCRVQLKAPLSLNSSESLARPEAALCLLSYLHLFSLLTFTMKCPPSTILEAPSNNWIHWDSNHWHVLISISQVACW